MNFDAILDPTGSSGAVQASALADRLSTLEGARVALIDNGKTNAGLLLNAIADRLVSYGVKERHTFAKPWAGTPVDASVIEEIQQVADFAIAAVGDCGACSAGTASDGLILERNGIPTVAICTRPFVVTAKAMAKSYGAPDFEFVFTAHPIASLQDTAIAERANEIVKSVVRMIAQPVAA